MNLAVLLAKHTSNQDGLPPEWPVLCLELHELTDLPQDGKPWLLMTHKELIELQRDNFQLRYDWALVKEQAQIDSANSILDPEEKEKALSEVFYLTKGYKEELEKDPNYNPYSIKLLSLKF